MWCEKWNQNAQSGSWWFIRTGNDKTEHSFHAQWQPELRTMNSQMQKYVCRYTCAFVLLIWRACMWLPDWWTTLGHTVACRVEVHTTSVDWDRGSVHADSSLKLHLSTEIIMYTEGDTACHLMTMDPSNTKSLRSNTDQKSITVKVIFLPFFQKKRLPFDLWVKASHSSWIKHWNSGHSRSKIIVIVIKNSTRQRAN